MLSGICSRADLNVTEVVERCFVHFATAGFWSCNFALMITQDNWLSRFLTCEDNDEDTTQEYSEMSHTTERPET